MTKYLDKQALIEDLQMTMKSDTAKMFPDAFIAWRATLTCLEAGDFDAPESESESEQLTRQISDWRNRAEAAETRARDAEHRAARLEKELKECRLNSVAEQRVIAAAIHAFDPRRRSTVKDHECLWRALADAVEALLAAEDKDDEEDLPSKRYGVFAKDTAGAWHRSWSCSEAFDSETAAQAAIKARCDARSQYHVRELRADEN